VTIMLVTALRAAETLTTFHRQRAEQTLAHHQAYSAEPDYGRWPPTRVG